MSCSAMASTVRNRGIHVVVCPDRLPWQLGDLVPKGAFYRQWRDSIFADGFDGAMQQAARGWARPITQSDP